VDLKYWGGSTTAISGGATFWLNNYFWLHRSNNHFFPVTRSYDDRSMKISPYRELIHTG
jgi:hypothetical protein